MRTSLTLLIFSLLAISGAYASQCPPAKGVALQVLGSGGPIADDDRASAAYLVWIDGQSRVLIDIGGGAILRFAEAGGDFVELDFVGLSHFHADHSADFPALLKSGNFSDRRRDLIVAGPDGSARFPGLRDFLASLFNAETGAFGYLAGYLDGAGNLARLAALEIHSGNIDAETVLGDVYSSMQIDALHVPHGIVPALAFRVRIGTDTIVFASDQNGSKKRFAEFAHNASILVMHMPVPENIKGVGRQLHAPPSIIGEIAKESNAEILVLSHFMERSLKHLDQNMDIVRSRFDGRVEAADDLSCYRISFQED